MKSGGQAFSEVVRSSSHIKRVSPVCISVIRHQLLVRCIFQAERRKILSAGLRFKSTPTIVAEKPGLRRVRDFGGSKIPKSIVFRARFAASLASDVEYLALLLVAPFGNER